MNEQLSKEDIKRMKPEQIEAARQAGQLDRIMGVPEQDIRLMEKVQSDYELGQSDLDELLQLKKYDLIVELDDAKRFDHLKQKSNKEIQ